MAVKDSAANDLEEEIDRLPALPLEELRTRWRRLFGNPAPKTLRRTFLARAIAYRMQVDLYGGLSAGTRARLREIAEAIRSGKPNAGLRKPITPGTQLIRQWRDKTHTVVALSDGFEWNGRVFKSLSSIAKEITGTSWNGYTFFGIERASLGNKNAAGKRNEGERARQHRAP